MMKLTLQLKQTIILIAAFCFAINCSGWQHRSINLFFVPNKIKYPEKYKDQLEPNSTLISALYHVTIEKTIEGKFVRKQFYPSTKQMTSYGTYSDKKLTIQDGLAKKWFDNGALISEGHYKAGKQIGEWKTYSTKNGITNLYQSGNYVNGKKEGYWKTYNEFGEVIKNANYKNEKLIRPKYSRSQLDSIMHVNEKWQAERAKEDKENRKYIVVDEMPSFPGCEEVNEKQEREECAENKMYEYIYQNLKYPPIAKEEKMEGRPRVHFTITKAGTIKDIQVSQATCEEFRLECIRIMKSMPVWNPGKKKGVVVNVKRTLVFNFLIDGSEASRRLVRKNYKK